MGEIDLKQKEELRKHMLSLRKGLTDIPFNLSLFHNTPEFSEAGCVAGYWPMAGEIDIKPLLNELPSCCLPVVIKKDNPLIFRSWKKGEVLIDGPHHTRQPNEKAETVTPDLVLVPLLAFDENGGRLGFGGGYYDRTLAELSALRVGIAYDEQEVDQVPMDQFDQRMDWIITPSRVIRCASVTEQG
jgi:5-formyltetrahydrofolate cyclo-ligase